MGQLQQCILLALLSFSLNLMAQKNFSPDHFTIEDGLSQNSVLSILKDKEDFLWIGTQDGLNMYNGNRFIVFRNDTKDSFSISGNYIHTLFEDSKGNIWIGTWGGGLSFYNKKNERFESFRNNPENPNSICSDYVNSITEDKNHNIWIGTRNGLARLNPLTKAFKIFQKDSLNPSSISLNDVSYVFADKEGIIWAATWGGGLNKFNEKDQTFTSFQHNPTDPTSIAHNIIRVIKETKDNKLWIGTWGGLDKFDKNNNIFEHTRSKGLKAGLTHNYVSSLSEDNKGRLWVGTWGGGLNILTNGKFHNDGLKSCGDLDMSFISSIISDEEGNVWIGTFKKGFYHFYNRPEQFKTYNNSTEASDNRQNLSNDDVKAIISDRNGIIWIGTEDGLNSFNPDKEEFSVFKSRDVYTGEQFNFAKSDRISSNSVWSVYEDKEANLWIGTSVGDLNMFDRKNESYSVFRLNPKYNSTFSYNAIKVITEDQKGNIWIGTWGNGIKILDRRKKKFANVNSIYPGIELKNNFINAMLFDKRGNTWIGTENGLIRINLEGKTRSTFDDIDIIENALINSLMEDHLGNIWIGSSRGLIKYNYKKNTFYIWKKKDGLPSEQVVAVCEDRNGNIWASTNNGLSQLNLIKKSFTNFSLSDGLQGNLFNPSSCTSGKDGRLYFGGVGGFSSFDPDSIHGNSYLPKVEITSFKILNKDGIYSPLKLKDSVFQVSYREPFFTIGFSSLSYADPKKNQFEYKLEEFDKNWINSEGKREATYTNLNGGTYTFLVRGSNNNGIWSMEPARMRIKVIPPWWYSPLFQAFALFIFVVGIYYSIEYKTARVQRKNRELESKVEERTRQINSQKKEIEEKSESLNELNLEIKEKNEELEKTVKERTLELQLRENQLRLITDSLPVLISYIDQNHIFRFCNKTYEEWFNRKKEEIIGKPIWEVIGEQAYLTAKGYVERALSGENIHYEIEMPYANKGNHFVSTFMVPHVNNNNVVGFYALISDISDRKKIEEALARALKEFEEKNEELTIINTDLDNFVYTASHDLRAPISNLEGLHQLLIRRVSEKLNESEKEIMDLMHKSIFRLKNTIGELSEIAKVQKEFLPQEVLYFEEIIREVKDDIEPLISEASAEIREVLEVKSIAYPKKHLRSILYNLISNAIKYRSTERSTIIEIKTTEFNGKTRLSVSDNGLGLEERQLGKLFKMFKRFHTHVEGSGIGLYMIKRMIENNGGSITVVSKPGEGTTFHVDF